MIFDSTIQPALLKGKVKASMRNRTYEVEMSVDMEDGIVDANCKCPRGQVICHHMAALCIHAHHNISSTDQACAWNVPGTSKGAEENVLCLKDLYPPKRDYVAVGRPLSSEEIANFRNETQNLALGICWLLNTEVEKAYLKLIPLIEEIIFSPEFISCQSKSAYFIEKCKISEKAIADIQVATIGQSKNENWLVLRKYRITASKFGMVLSACKRNRYPPSLYKNLMEGYDINSVKAVQWGREHEAEAIEVFKTATGLEVMESGLWLDTCGFLGASPDGLVGDDALLEVKCPYKLRNGNLDEFLQTTDSYVISQNPDTKEMSINKHHSYYHQIQGQLWITGRQQCFLVVWTPQQSVIVPILKEEGWCENVPILKDFYVNKFLFQL
ncbi:hypothetical protein RI129_003245 [Pyrocoelia pectoralis]|uniref:SWIM-type domain-containing protein n=1 Tax=Pyrocoelia pectoralis TaxID=417401 RepID=A0AAN7ZUS8_9COLE